MLERYLDDPESRLPLTVGKYLLEKVDMSVRAKVNHLPVTLQLRTAMKLVAKADETKCNMKVESLRGCYNCLSGAELQLYCNTDQGFGLAYVSCMDGTNFVQKCMANVTLYTITLPFNHAQVDTECAVSCSGGTTSFQLKGHLHYVPPSELEKKTMEMAYASHSRNRLNISLSTHIPWCDSLAVLVRIDICSVVNSFMMLPWVLGVALLSMGVVYVMIKLHPWRLGYRLLVILLVLGIAVKTDSAPSSHVSFLLGGGAYSVLYKPDPSLRIYPHLSHSNSDANRMVLTIPLINVIWRATGLTTAAQIEDKLRLCGGDEVFRAQLLELLKQLQVWTDHLGPAKDFRIIPIGISRLSASVHTAYFSSDLGGGYRPITVREHYRERQKRELASLLALR